MDSVLVGEAKSYIFADISRELSLVDASNKHPKLLEKANIPLGAGNFLCALGLFSYIEFAGKIKYSNKKTNGMDHASKNFNDFFDDLGDYYKDFRLSFENNNFVYDTFRCGLVHEYYIKHDFQVAMFGALKYRGIGKLKNGQYYVIIKNLFDDFMNEFNKL